MGQHAGMAPEQQRALDRIRDAAGSEGLYLAGGSAIAFHLHHRRSLDVDLFSLSGNYDLEQLRESLRELSANFEVLDATNVAVHMRVEGVAVDVVRYPYPPLEAPREGPGGFPVAGLRDLAAMKLAAIARRGIRRDFWDLYVMCSGPLTLRAAGEAYGARYGKFQPEMYHVWRSLTYFEDAEKDSVLPLGLDPAGWEEIKQFFRCQVRALMRV